MYWQASLAVSYDSTGWLVGSIAITLVYLVIAPVFFFLCLYPTHRAMRRHIDSLLEPISAEFQATYQKVFDDRCENSRSTNACLAKLRQLDKLREYTLRLPKWPFTVRDFRKYYVLVSSPVFSFIVGLSIEWIARSYFGS